MTLEPGAEDREKILRVKLPIHYHIQLHKLKLHEGITMSDAVRSALDDYFQRVGLEPEALDEGPPAGERDPPKVDHRRAPPDRDAREASQAARY